MELAEVKRVSAHLRCLNIYEKRPQTKMFWSGKIMCSDAPGVSLRQLVYNMFDLKKSIPLYILVSLLRPILLILFNTLFPYTFELNVKLHSY